MEASENYNKSWEAEDNQQKLPKDKITGILSSYDISLQNCLVPFYWKAAEGLSIIRKDSRQIYETPSH